MPFVNSTRLRKIILPTLTKPTGGGLTQVDLPKVGILHRLDLLVTYSIAGTLTVPNAYGQCSILNRIRLAINAGIDIINVSGPGYNWLMRDFIDLMLDPVPQNTSRAAVAVVTNAIGDIVLPVAINQREEFGLIMLQNEQTLATLQVTWEADATIATGATVTGTIVPIMYYFEIPQSVRDWPRFDVVHQFLEDGQSIPGAGDFTYNWPRGNTYLGVYHLSPPAQTWTTARLRAQQGNIIQDETPGSMISFSNQNHGRDLTLSGGAITGTNKRVMWDLMGPDGLGAFGSQRDLIDSSRLTDLSSVINFSGSGTMLSVRRQLVSLAG